MIRPRCLVLTVFELHQHKEHFGPHTPPPLIAYPSPAKSASSACKDANEPGRWVALLSRNSSKVETSATGSEVEARRRQPSSKASRSSQ